MRQSLSGLKIRARRKQAGLTQSELARRAGISPSYLNLIECNKRAIAGRLVDRIAAGLGVERSALDGEAERRIVATLEEIASEADIKGSSGHPGPAEDLVGRNPGWASLILSLHRAWRDQSQAVLALADRLSRDPFLGDSVHRMLTHAASIRSAAEILETDDLSQTERHRFRSIVAADSQRLSVVAKALLEFFDSTRIRVRSATPAEHVDAFILAEDNCFPDLETVASGFLKRRRSNESAAAAAERVLAERGLEAPGANAAQTASTRRFTLVREALKEETAGALGGYLQSHPALASEESRHLAASALQSYAAAAVLMPYDPFLEAAERWRYDIDALCRPSAFPAPRPCVSPSCARTPRATSPSGCRCRACLCRATAMPARCGLSTRPSRPLALPRAALGNCHPATSSCFSLAPSRNIRRQRPCRGTSSR
jgi:transcriptional regulator with XRE-family HTH domain